MDVVDRSDFYGSGAIAFVSRFFGEKECISQIIYITSTKMR